VRRSSIAWTAGCSLLLVPGVGLAQAPLDRACHPRIVSQNPPADAYWIERFPDTVAVRLSPVEREGAWTRSVRHVVQLLREDARFFGAGSGLEQEYAAVLREAELFQTRLGEALDRAEAEGVPGAAVFVVQEDPAGGEYSLLNDAVAITASDDIEAARSLCWAGHNLHRLHTRLTTGARLASEMELQARVNRWAAFNDRGLTPFPWELALNEAVGWLGTRTPLEPPTVQLIALRPSVGVELDSRLGGRTDVLAMEVLGVVAYVGHRSWYLGTSFLWTAPTGANAGYGALVHLAPWLKGGPVWRDANDDGQRDLRWVLSVDAFDIFQGAPRSLREAADRATDGRLGR